MTSVPQRFGAEVGNLGPARGGGARVGGTHSYWVYSAPFSVVNIPGWCPPGLE